MIDMSTRKREHAAPRGHPLQNPGRDAAVSLLGSRVAVSVGMAAGGPQ